MINQIKIKNFRCIEDVSIGPKNINIFVGRNNTGKSSILYAIATAFLRQEIYIESHNRMKYLVRMPEKKAEIEINSENFGIKTTIFNDFEDVPEEYKREIYITIKDKIQILSNDFKKHFKTEIDLDKIFSIVMKIMKEYGITVLNEYTPINNSSKEHALSFILDFLGYRESLDIFRKELKLSKDSKESVRLEFLIRRIIDSIISFMIGNENITKKINLNIYTELEPEVDTDEKTLLALENIIRKDVFPELKRLGKDSVVLEKKGKLLEIPIEIYGDGLKALLTILKLFVDSENGVLLLEEPENHLHPGYMSLLIKYLIEYSEKLKVQLFISTHSIDLLEEFLKYKNLNKKLQIIRMYKDETKEKISTEILNFEDAKEEEKMKLDIRGI